MGLYRILFRSQTKINLSDWDIANIVEGAKVRNRHNDITGMLLFVNECFMGVMEGEEQIIKNVYFNRIHPDSRHHRLKIVVQGDIAERDFPYWDFGVSMLEQLEMKSPLNQVAENPNIILGVMKYFFMTGEIDLTKFWQNNIRSN